MIAQTKGPKTLDTAGHFLWSLVDSDASGGTWADRIYTNTSRINGVTRTSPLHTCRTDAKKPWGSTHTPHVHTDVMAALLGFSIVHIIHKLCHVTCRHLFDLV